MPAGQTIPAGGTIPAGRTIPARGTIPAGRTILVGRTIPGQTASVLCHPGTASFNVVSPKGSQLL